MSDWDFLKFKYGIKNAPEVPGAEIPFGSTKINVNFNKLDGGSQSYSRHLLSQLTPVNCEELNELNNKCDK